MEAIKLEVQISQELAGMLMIVGVSPKSLMEKISKDLSLSGDDAKEQSPSFYKYIAQTISECKGFNGTVINRIMLEMKKQAIADEELLHLDIKETLSEPSKVRFCEGCGEIKL